MRQRCRLYFREKTGRFYIHDDLTGKQESLHTKDKATALRLFHSRSEAEQQPAINLQIARAYLAATDAQIATRTWQYVMDEMVKLKKGEMQHRWQTAIKGKAFNTIRDLPVLQTRPEQFLLVLEAGKVSTNVYLRRIHNFALDMTWLPWPVIVKRQWPKVEFKDKRAITWEEHQASIAREQNPERKAFYQVAWYLGASQSDLAFLVPENVDWENHVISYQRMETRTIAIMRLNEEVMKILRELPQNGPLFPYVRSVRAGDRATEFKQRCDGLGIKGISLHSHRYAWAERARMCGFPLWFAQEALGHNSKAVHHAYASKAEVKVPSLDMWEKQRHEQIVEMKFDGDSAANLPGGNKAGDEPAAPPVVARP
jgi:integrase